MASTYCAAVRKGPTDDYNRAYHDTEYGFPSRVDEVLFERLVLEINQAGLSWLMILKKRDGFRAAYRRFNVATVAGFTDADRARLLADPAIIRNRLKIDAAIANARALLPLIEQHGSFATWLDTVQPLDLPEWIKLFKRTFRFTGGEIVREFLVSLGYLPGAHDPDCPVYRAIHPAR